VSEPAPPTRGEPGAPRARSAAPVPRRTARVPSRRTLAIAAALFLAVVLVDWSRAPSKQWTVRLELAVIARYQAWLSPVFARAGARCRFTPSCSRYAAAVLARDGALVGNARAAWRIVRCAPWTPAGTVEWP
jgi:putative membrane protein insertion efficiency factor